MQKTTLTLDALEAREVPAAIGLVKIDPIALPPSVASTPVRLGFDTTAAVSAGNLAKWGVPPFAVGGKTGIFLPSLSPATPAPAAAPNAILFPVFVGK